MKFDEKLLNQICNYLEDHLDFQGARDFKSIGESNWKLDLECINVNDLVKHCSPDHNLARFDDVKYILKIMSLFDYIELSESGGQIIHVTDKGIKFIFKTLYNVNFV